MLTNNHINERPSKYGPGNLAKLFVKNLKDYVKSRLNFSRDRDPRLSAFVRKGDYKPNIKSIDNLNLGDYLLNRHYGDRKNPNYTEWVKEILPNGSVKMKSGLTFNKDQILKQFRLIPEHKLMNKKEKLIRELIRRTIKEILKESFSDGSLESEEAIKKTARVLGMELVGELDKPSFDLRKEIKKEIMNSIIEHQKDNRLNEASKHDAKKIALDLVGLNARDKVFKKHRVDKYDAETSYDVIQQAVDILKRLL